MQISRFLLSTLAIAGLLLAVWRSDTVSASPAEKVPPLEVRIEAMEPPTFGTWLILQTHFTNPAGVPQTVITPQDGSLVGWLSPKYTVSDEVVGPNGARIHRIF